MIKINSADIHYQFTKSAGPGGQNVNKVETAVQLRFNVFDSDLPELVRARLITLPGIRITQSGDLIIKANRYRTQEANKQDAFSRLMGWIEKASIVPKKRKKTKPTRASKEKRLQKKKIHAKTKRLRRSQNVGEN